MMHELGAADDAPLVIGGETLRPGERRTIDLALPPLYTHTSVALPVHVIRGRRSGPVLGVLAAIHGDEINGIEIIRRLITSKNIARLRGTLVAVPVVNVYGFVSQSRYLPDRRDLNRSFPGSERGSMAARLADIVLAEIVEHCSHVIDYHTAARGRTNLPQIRLDIDLHPEALPLAKAFGSPIIIDMPTRNGTLRGAVRDRPVLLYEAGEALRFDEVAIRAGLRGTLRVMRALGMLPPLKDGLRENEPYVANDSVWMRANQSGIMRSRLPLGAAIEKGQILGVIADPFGESEQPVISSVSGVLIGMTRMPLVHEGEALFHVACTSNIKQTRQALQAVDDFHQGYD